MFKEESIRNNKLYTRYSKFDDFKYVRDLTPEEISRENITKVLIRVGWQEPKPDNSQIALF